MNILDRQPEEILTPSWCEAYERRISAIWWVFVRLNSQIFVLEEIKKFPFDILYPPPPPNHFWKLVEVSLLETSLNIIWKITADRHADALTIFNLKQDILTNLRNRNFIQDFNDILEKKRFDERLEKFIDKVNTLRKKYIGHLNRECHTTPTNDDLSILKIEPIEILKCRDTLNEFLDVLCFGHHRAKLPFEYKKDMTQNQEPADIQSILEILGRNSPFISLPENDPIGWEAYQQTLNKDKMKIFNNWRKRAGLPEV